MAVITTARDAAITASAVAATTTRIIRIVAFYPHE
jgi:hypothetical protein